MVNTEGWQGKQSTSEYTAIALGCARHSIAQPVLFGLYTSVHEESMVPDHQLQLKISKGCIMLSSIRD